MFQVHGCDQCELEHTRDDKWTRTWLDGRLPSDGPRACAPPTMCTFWDWVIEMEKRHFPIGVILWANFDATSLQLYVVIIQSSPV